MKKGIPALFLDRDGVINVDHAYVHKKENFQFVDGIFEVVSTANRLGFLVIVITNQAGIGRGYYSEQDFHELTGWMCEKFSDYGAKIDKVYYCPYHPDFGVGRYRRKSEFRKPAPGMILKATNEHEIDLSRSVIIGDKLTDIQAGINAGVKHLFYFGTDKVLTALTIHQLSEIIPILQNIADWN